eukprot:3414226-Prymnesium_polylepis.1
MGLARSHACRQRTAALKIIFRACPLHTSRAPGCKPKVVRARPGRGGQRRCAHNYAIAPVGAHRALLIPN